MPILADPNAPEPTPPVQWWSPDGLVRLIEDPAWSAVWIVADFGTVNLVGNPGGETDTSGWTPPSGVTVSRDTTNPITGTASLKFTVTAGGSDKMPQYDVTSTKGVGSVVTALASVRNDSVATRTFRTRVFETNDFANRDDAAVTLGPGEQATVRVKHAKTTTATTRITPGMMSTQTGDMWSVDDVMIVDGDYDGPFRLPSYPAVKRIRVVRTNPDGSQVIVRGANPSWASGGIGVAYDFEPPLNSPISYYVEGLGWRGETILATSQSVSMQTSEPSRAWLKSVDDPSLSLQVRVADWDEGGRDADVTLTKVLGRRRPVANLGTPSGWSGTLSVITSGRDEYDAMQGLMDSGVMLLQTPDAMGMPRDLYVVRTGEMPVGRYGLMSSGWRRFEVALTEVDPPPSDDQPARIPGHTFAARLADYPTFADVPNRTFLEGLLS